MGGICLIGEYMQDLSELIRKHEEIYGDQSQRITSVPTMTELRLTPEQKRKKEVLEQQKKSEKKKKSQKEWYANNRVQQIDKAKKWNKDNGTARKLIVDRYKNKQKNKGWSNGS